MRNGAGENKIQSGLANGDVNRSQNFVIRIGNHENSVPQKRKPRYLAALNENPDIM